MSLNKVDCRGNTDIIYNFTQEDKTNFSNNYGMDVSAYNKIVLNYSGNSYGSDVLSFDMRTASSINTSDFIKILAFFADKNLIKLDINVSFGNNSNNQYAKIIFPYPFDTNNVYNTKLTIPKSSQLILNVDDIPTPDRFLPSNYQRVIFNFIKKGESSNDNNSNSNSPIKQIANIVNNPKTSSTISIVCFVIIVSAVSLIVLNLKKNNA